MNIISDIVEDITNFSFAVNSSDMFDMQCYNISVPMKDDCSLYINCTDITVNSQLSLTPFKDSDSVSIIQSRRVIEVVVPIPERCTCSESTQSTVLSVAGTVGIAVSSFIILSSASILLLLSLFFYKRRKTTQ